MLFKDISYLEHWQSICSVEQNNLCYLGKRVIMSNNCEIILNLDWSLLRECHLKLFLISICRALAALFFSCAILVSCVMWNNSVTLF